MYKSVSALAFGPFRRNAELSEALSHHPDVRVLRCATGWPALDLKKGLTRVNYPIENANNEAHQRARAVRMTRAAADDIERSYGGQVIVFYSTGQMADIEYDIAVRVLKQLRVPYVVIGF